MNLPHAYICTLMRSQERVENVRRNIVEKLDSEKCIIWPAIDGQTNDLESFFEKKGSELSMDLRNIEKHGYACPRTALSIICSAIYILEDAVNKNLDDILFFEDDAQLSDGFYQKLELMVKELPENADFLKIYCKFGLKNDFSIAGKRYIQNYPLKSTQEAWGADALYFTRKGILNILNVLKRTNTIFDGVFIDYNNEGSLKGYLTKYNGLCVHKHGNFKSNNARTNNISRCYESIGLLDRFQSKGKINEL